MSEICSFNIPDKIYDVLNEIIKDKSKKYNSRLAGNIKEEYNLQEHIPYVKKFIETIADNNFKWMKNFPLSSNKNKCLVLKELWVNYQKKLEFNPLHCHDGILSFILFIKIPYNIEDELKAAPGIDSVKNLAGHLQFVCPNKGFFRSLETKSIPVDKKFEKKGLMFPALLYHTVYPFYKNEDLRITISGNLFLDDKTN